MPKPYMQTVLDATGYSFAHFGWSRAPAGNYGVWAEDGANDLQADDIHSEHAVEGTVDYFTRDDSGAPQATVEAALNNGAIAWYLNSIQFEDDTGYIHYEWVVEWLS